MTRRTEVFKTLLTVMQVAVIGSAAAVLLELFKYHQSSVAHQIDRQRRALQDSRQAYDEIKTVRRLLKARQPEHRTLKTSKDNERKWPPVGAEWVVEHRALLERVGERLIKSQLQLEFLKEQYPEGSRTGDAFKEMERLINPVSKVLLHAGCRDLDEEEIQLLNSFLGDDFKKLADPYHTVLAELSA